MIDPATHALVNSVLAFLASHTPWLADKMGGAAITQAVRETWDLMKKKLASEPGGKQALDKLASGTSNAEALEGPLTSALQSDPNFASELSQRIATIQQLANGNNNKQGLIVGSQGASINIS